MFFKFLNLAALPALLFSGCSGQKSKKYEIKKPLYIEVQQPASLTAFSSPGITFSLKSADGSLVTDYNDTVTLNRRLIKNEACPGDAKSLHAEKIDLRFVSGVATLDAVFERPGRYFLDGNLPDWNLILSSPVEVASNLPIELRAREFIRAGQTNLGRIKKTSKSTDLTALIEWLSPADLDPISVSLTDENEKELNVASPLISPGELEFRVMDPTSNHYFPCRVKILSGRIKNAELGTSPETGSTLNFFDDYGNQFLDTAFMKYSIVRDSDSQTVGENSSWIDGRAGYKIRDQIPPGDYLIKLQFRESGEVSLGSEVTLVLRL